MEKKIVLLVILTAVLIAPVGYLIIIVDWIRDYSSGIYTLNPLEALVETAALLAYTYFGVRFFNRHINSLRS